jgi:hypothetical protein
MNKMIWLVLIVLILLFVWKVLGKGYPKAA